MVDKSRANAESTREGGREDAERPSVGIPSSFAAGSRSGSASHAASILDIRMKLNFLLEELQSLAQGLGDADQVMRIKQFRQQGFRSNRGPRG